MIVAQLMGSLYTYELKVLSDDNPTFGKKGESMAFTAEEYSIASNNDKTVALLTRNFKRFE